MIKKTVKLLLSTLFILSIFYIGSKTFAANEIVLQESDISADIAPNNPQPYQDVTVSLTSYSTDLNKAMIKWQNGSNIVLSGYGKKTYSFKTLGPNTITILDISIESPDSVNAISKRVVINPSEVDLIWEGINSYTPPFYRGKSFPSSEGMIKVVAIPNTNTIKQNKGSVTYNWKSNDNTVLPASGYNKDSYVFKNSELNDGEKITVVVESLGGNYSATNTIKIPITKPEVIFYKKSPTDGVLYNQAITNDTFISEEEVSLVAEPYFLDIKGNEGDFAYSWKINGKDIDTPSKKTELTIRPASRGGYATIDVLFNNLNTLYQHVSGKIKINL